MDEPANLKPGFRPIGSLPRLVGNARLSTNAVPGRPNVTNSSTTTPPAEASWPTGTPRGEPGAVTLRNSEQLAVAVVSAADERNSKRALVELLKALCGSQPAEDSSSRFGADGQFESHLDGLRLPVMSAHRLQQAWAIVGPLCLPARDDRGAQRKIIEEWSRLKAVTVGRAEHGADSDLATDTVLDELNRYPADCVIRALKSWREGHKWRPALSEILGDVQWRARYRMLLREAFERAGAA